MPPDHHRNNRSSSGSRVSNENRCEIYFAMSQHRRRVVNIKKIPSRLVRNTKVYISTSRNGISEALVQRFENLEYILTQTWI